MTMNLTCSALRTLSNDYTNLESFRSRRSILMICLLVRNLMSWFGDAHRRSLACELEQDNPGRKTPRLDLVEADHWMPTNGVRFEF